MSQLSAPRLTPARGRGRIALRRLPATRSLPPSIALDPAWPSATALTRTHHNTFYAQISGGKIDRASRGRRCLHEGAGCGVEGGEFERWSR
eukprot:3931843-Rhodomonas_salina.2